MQIDRHGVLCIGLFWMESAHTLYYLLSALTFISLRETYCLCYP